MPVLLVRPDGSNASMASRLASHGIEVRVEPLLEIDSLALDPISQKRVRDLDQYDHVIFISQNAVAFGLPHLQDYWPQWPLGLHWYAVGRSTAARLALEDIEAVVPSPETTEGLLAIPALFAVAGHKVLIVRGRGGRQDLADSLTALGASVDYLEVYSRRPRQLEPDAIDRIRNLHPLVVLIYSTETLMALLASVPVPWSGLRLVVPSDRIRAQAEENGIERVALAAAAQDDEMLEATLKVLAETP